MECPFKVGDKVKWTGTATIYDQEFSVELQGQVVDIDFDFHDRLAKTSKWWRDKYPVTVKTLLPGTETPCFPVLSSSILSLIEN